MKSSINELRTKLRNFFTEAILKEDVDRLRRAADGYGETEFEEDVDRLRRAADGYGETEFEEDVDRLRRAAEGYGETEFEEGKKEDDEKAKSSAYRPSGFEGDSEIGDMAVGEGFFLSEEEAEEGDVEHNLGPEFDRMLGELFGNLSALRTSEDIDSQELIKHFMASAERTKDLKKTAKEMDDFLKTIADGQYFKPIRPPWGAALSPRPGPIR